MRTLVLVLVLAALSGCASDQYTSLPQPKGPWEPANADMRNADNNLVPRPLASVLGPAPSPPPSSSPVATGSQR